MTREELITIYRLKRKGLTSKEIADKTSISQSSIRMRFSRFEEFKEEGVCPCCGKKFEITIDNPYKKYCSKKCKRKYLNANRGKGKTAPVKTCQFCGRSFSVYLRPHQKYCSFECYQNARLVDHE